MVTLQIVVTEKCNLSCSYCYMNNRNTFLTREAFTDFYESLPSNQEYKLDFFGGEPLMNWDIIKFIVESTRSDTRFKELSIYSNGLLLTQEMVEFIKQNNIKFLWSCDGLVEENTNEYLNKSDLIGQLCDSVSVTITPDNLELISNYKFFIDNFGLTPDIRFVKSGWRPNSVEQFKVKYSEYIDFILDEFKNKRILVPENIIRDIKVLYEGIKKGIPKQRCVDSSNKCLMPDGSVGFCAMKCTNGDYTIPDDYDELYADCIGCDITNFCGKGCFEMVEQNGYVDKSMCELTRFTLYEAIRFNHELKRDGHWIGRYIRNIFSEYNYE